MPWTPPTGYIVGAWHGVFSQAVLFGRLWRDDEDPREHKLRVWLLPTDFRSRPEYDINTHTQGWLVGHTEEQAVELAHSFVTACGNSLVEAGHRMLVAPEYTPIGGDTAACIRIFEAKLAAL